MSNIFAAQVTYNVGSNPWAVAIADVNGDGKPDIINSNYYSATISILINQGTLASPFTPAFAPQVIYNVGSNPVRVAIADVNGDGKPDIVCTNFVPATISILINQGTFASPFTVSFASQVTYNVSSDPYGVAIADVNGDGKPDIVSGNEVSTTVSILINQGAFASPFTVNFTSQVTYNVSSDPYGVAIADVNGDGKPDIVGTSWNSAAISVLINQGTFVSPFTPAFAPQVAYSVGSNPYEIAIADVNGDGKPDVICANWGTGSGNSVSVLVNQGTFASPFTVSFASQVTYGVGSGPYGVAIADVNSDSKPDIICSNAGSGTGTTISVLINQGTFVSPFTPAFAPQVTYSVGSNPLGVAVADVNGDGKPDVVSANYGDNTVSVLANVYQTSTPTPTHTVTQTATYTGSDSVTRSLTQTLSYRTQSLTHSITASRSATTTRSGSYSPVTRSLTASHTQTQSPTRSLTQTLSYRTHSPTQSLTASRDTATPTKPYKCLNSPFPATISATAWADGVRGFLINGLAAAGFGYSVANAGDINGDGLPDLIVGAPYANSNAGAVYVIFGATSFPASFSILSLTGSNGFSMTGPAGSWFGCSVSGVGDINGDGIADFVVGHSGANSASGAAHVVFGATSFPASFSAASLTGTNGFSITGTTNSALGTAVFGAGDINGDGMVDLVVGAYHVSFPVGTAHVIFGAVSFPASFSISSLTGSNGFSITGVVGGFGRSASGLGDINGDGKMDFAVGAFRANSDAGAAYVVFGASSFPASFSTSSLTGTNGFCITGPAGSQLGWSIAGIGDINGDGKGDLIVGTWGNPTPYNQAFIVFGASSFPASFNTSALAGTNGLRIAGPISSDFGISISGAGDINGDGRTDMIMGADIAGAAYVVFGTTPFSTSLATSMLNGANGFNITGPTGGTFGSSVSSAGDINGDGIDDLIVGASGSNQAFILYGQNLTTCSATLSPSVSPTITRSQSNTRSLTLSITKTPGSHTHSQTGTASRSTTVTVAAPVTRSGSYSPVTRSLTPSGTKTQSLTRSLTQTLSYRTHSPTRSLSMSRNTATPTKPYKCLNSPFPAVFNVDTSLTGGNGFKLTTSVANGQFGNIVASTGDFNGDGIEDAIIGAYYAGSGTGAAYVVFGSHSGFASPFNVNTQLNGTNGFKIATSVTNGNLGFSVASAGDINGDGIADLVVGTYYPGSNDGAAYVVFGSRNSFVNPFNVDTQLNGSNGFKLTTSVATQHFGTSAASAGDFNGDGIADLAVGAYYASSGTGAAYVVFGSRSGFVNPFNVDIQLNGTNGFKLTTSVVGGQFGVRVASAGDFNNDGVADLVIGAYSTGSNTGAAYMVYGSHGGFLNPFNVDMQLNGTNGFKLITSIGGGYFGGSLASIGDFSGDGIADLAVGAYYASSGTGAAYVLYGSNSAFANPFNVDTQLNSSNGFKLATNVAGGQFGISVAPAGDFNGDGVADMIVGAANSTAGTAYIIYGSNSAFANPFNADTALTRINGLKLITNVPGMSFGWSVASAGDFNGDGVADVITGAYNANSNAGAAYIIYGQNLTTCSATISPSASHTTTRSQSSTRSRTLSLTHTPSATNTRSATKATHSATVTKVAPVTRSGSYSPLTHSPTTSGTKTQSQTRSLTQTLSYRTHSPTRSLTASLDTATQTKPHKCLNSPFPATISAAAWADGVRGFLIDGAASGFGAVVAETGDVNGDGWPDVIVGAPTSNQAFVVFGAASFSAFFSASTLNGSNGFLIQGPAGSGFGWSVSSAGDINGDGKDDLIIGANTANSSTGAAYLVFGAANFPAFLATTVLNGSNGFIIRGVLAGASLGYSLSRAGDLNGDGKSDLVVGTNGAGGQAFVVFGAASFPASFTTSVLNGSNGFLIQGPSAGWFGNSVAGAVDINGDGKDDLVIGAGNTYRTFVIFGAATFSASFNVAALNGSNGFLVHWPASSNIGGFVSGAGDVNGDGKDDLIVGMAAVSQAFVVFGSANFASSLDTTMLNGSNGFFINGPTGSGFGGSLSNAGDINDDGKTDLVIGAYATNQAFVVFGSASFAASLYTTTLNGTNGFLVYGPTGSRLGCTTSNADDINGDGVDDLIIGAINTNQAYIIYGQNLTTCSATLSPSASHTATRSQSSTRSQTLSLTHTPSATNTRSATKASHSATVTKVAPVTRSSSYSPLTHSPTTSGTKTQSQTRSLTQTLSYRTHSPTRSLTASLDTATQTKPHKCLNSPFPAVFNVDTSLTGNNGFKVITSIASEWFGYSVASAGDFNGDGKEDFIVGAPHFNSNAGAAYIVYGSGIVFTSPFNVVTALTGTNGFKLTTSVSGGYFGLYVASAGDFNGDGKADIIVGAYFAGGGTGSVYLIYGSSSPFASPFNVDASLTGTNGFRLTTSVANGYFGVYVASAGDFNGDGRADVVIGARTANAFAGAAYIIYGSSTAFANPFNVDASLTGANGFKLITNVVGGDFGVAIASAGDFNGDGRDDIIVGANNANAAYVVYGNSAAFTNPFNVDIALTGANGFKLITSMGGENFGYPVASVGDFNGDGKSDLIVGASAATSNTGAAYVIYGSSNAFTNPFNVDANLTGTNGFKLTTSVAGGLFGRSAASASDFNGDGLADLVIGAPYTSLQAGAAYVVYGGSTTFANPFNVDAVLNGNNGFKLTTNVASEGLGFSVASVGDFNGDGNVDLAVGAYGSGTIAGAAYIIYGQNLATCSATISPSASHTTTRSKSSTRSQTLSLTHTPSATNTRSATKATHSTTTTQSITHSPLTHSPTASHTQTQSLTRSLTLTATTRSNPTHSPTLTTHTNTQRHTDTQRHIATTFTDSTASATVSARSRTISSSLSGSHTPSSTPTPSKASASTSVSSASAGLASASSPSGSGSASISQTRTNSESNTASVSSSLSKSASQSPTPTQLATAEPTITQSSATGSGSASISLTLATASRSGTTSFSLSRLTSQPMTVSSMPSLLPTTTDSSATRSSSGSVSSTPATISQSGTPSHSSSGLTTKSITASPAPSLQPTTTDSSASGSASISASPTTTASSGSRTGSFSASPSASASVSVSPPATLAPTTSQSSASARSPSGSGSTSASISQTRTNSESNAASVSSSLSQSVDSRSMTVTQLLTAQPTVTGSSQTNTITTSASPTTTVSKSGTASLRSSRLTSRSISDSTTPIRTLTARPTATDSSATDSSSGSVSSTPATISQSGTASLSSSRLTSQSMTISSMPSLQPTTTGSSATGSGSTSASVSLTPATVSRSGTASLSLSKSVSQSSTSTQLLTAQPTTTESSASASSKTSTIATSDSSTATVSKSGTGSRSSSKLTSQSISDSATPIRTLSALPTTTETSASGTASTSTSPTIKTSGSRTGSGSASPSASTSTSVSPSATLIPSASQSSGSGVSVSISASPTAATSRSRTLSGSTSSSTSVSVTASQPDTLPPTASQSSASVGSASISASPTTKTSESKTNSFSASPSASMSVSVSPSATLAPTASLSSASASSPSSSGSTSTSQTRTNSESNAASISSSLSQSAASKSMTVTQLLTARPTATGSSKIDTIATSASPTTTASKSRTTSHSSSKSAASSSQSATSSRTHSAQLASSTPSVSDSVVTSASTSHATATTCESETASRSPSKSVASPSQSASSSRAHSAQPVSSTHSVSNSVTAASSETRSHTVTDTRSPTASHSPSESIASPSQSTSPNRTHSAQLISATHSASGSVTASVSASSATADSRSKIISYSLSDSVASPSQSATASRTHSAQLISSTRSVSDSASVASSETRSQTVTGTRSPTASRSSSKSAASSSQSATSSRTHSAQLVSSTRSASSSVTASTSYTTVTASASETTSCSPSKFTASSSRSATASRTHSSQLVSSTRSASSSVVTSASTSHATATTSESGTASTSSSESVVSSGRSATSSRTHSAQLNSTTQSASGSVTTSASTSRVTNTASESSTISGSASLSARTSASVSQIETLAPTTSRSSASSGSASTSVSPTATASSQSETSSLSASSSASVSETSSLPRTRTLVPTASLSSASDGSTAISPSPTATASSESRTSSLSASPSARTSASVSQTETLAPSASQSPASETVSISPSLTATASSESKTGSLSASPSASMSTSVSLPATLAPTTSLSSASSSASVSASPTIKTSASKTGSLSASPSASATGTASLSRTRTLLPTTSLSSATGSSSASISLTPTTVTRSGTTRVSLSKLTSRSITVSPPATLAPTTSQSSASSSASVSASLTIKTRRSSTGSFSASPSASVSETSSLPRTRTWVPTASLSSASDDSASVSASPTIKTSASKTGSLSASPSARTSASVSQTETLAPSASQGSASETVSISPSPTATASSESKTCSLSASPSASMSTSVSPPATLAPTTSLSSASSSASVSASPTIKTSASRTGSLSASPSASATGTASLPRTRTWAPTASLSSASGSISASISATPATASGSKTVSLSSSRLTSRSTTVSHVPSLQPTTTDSSVSGSSSASISLTLATASQSGTTSLSASGLTTKSITVSPVPSLQPTMTNSSGSGGSASISAPSTAMASSASKTGSLSASLSPSQSKTGSRSTTAQPTTATASTSVTTAASMTTTRTSSESDTISRSRSVTQSVTGSDTITPTASALHTATETSVTETSATASSTRSDRTSLAISPSGTITSTASSGSGATTPTISAPHTTTETSVTKTSATTSSTRSDRTSLAISPSGTTTSTASSGSATTTQTASVPHTATRTSATTSFTPPASTSLTVSKSGTAASTASSHSDTVTQTASVQRSTTRTSATATETSATASFTSSASTSLTISVSGTTTSTASSGSGTITPTISALHTATGTSATETSATTSFTPSASTSLTISKSSTTTGPSTPSDYAVASTASDSPSRSTTIAPSISRLPTVTRIPTTGSVTQSASPTATASPSSSVSHSATNSRSQSASASDIANDAGSQSYSATKSAGATRSPTFVIPTGSTKSPSASTTAVTSGTASRTFTKSGTSSNSISQHKSSLSHTATATVPSTPSGYAVANAPRSTPQQSPAQLPTATPGQIAAVSPAQLLAATPGQIPALAPALSPAQVPDLSPTQIQDALALRPPNVGSFSPWVISGFSPRQVEAGSSLFSPEQVQALSPEQVPILAAAPINATVNTTAPPSSLAAASAESNKALYYLLLIPAALAVGLGAFALWWQRERTRIVRTYQVAPEKPEPDVENGITQLSSDSVDQLRIGTPSLVTAQGSSDSRAPSLPGPQDTAALPEFQSATAAAPEAAAPVEGAVAVQISDDAVPASLEPQAANAEPLQELPPHVWEMLNPVRYDTAISRYESAFDPFAELLCRELRRLYPEKIIAPQGLANGLSMVRNYLSFPEGSMRMDDDAGIDQVLASLAAIARRLGREPIPETSDPMLAGGLSALNKMITAARSTTQPADSSAIDVEFAVPQRTPLQMARTDRRASLDDEFDHILAQLNKRLAERAITQAAERAVIEQEATEKHIELAMKLTAEADDEWALLEEQLTTALKQAEARAAERAKAELAARAAMAQEAIAEHDTFVRALETEADDAWLLWERQLATALKQAETRATERAEAEQRTELEQAETAAREAALVSWQRKEKELAELEQLAELELYERAARKILDRKWFKEGKKIADLVRLAWLEKSGRIEHAQQEETVRQALTDKWWLERTELRQQLIAAKALAAENAKRRPWEMMDMGEEPAVSAAGAAQIAQALPLDQRRPLAAFGIPAAPPPDLGLELPAFPAPAPQPPDRQYPPQPFEALAAPRRLPPAPPNPPPPQQPPFVGNDAPPRLVQLRRAEELQRAQGGLLEMLRRAQALNAPEATGAGGLERGHAAPQAQLLGALEAGDANLPPGERRIAHRPQHLNLGIDERIRKERKYREARGDGAEGGRNGYWTEQHAVAQLGPTAAIVETEDWPVKLNTQYGPMRFLLAPIRFSLEPISIGDDSTSEDHCAVEVDSTSDDHRTVEAEHCVFEGHCVLEWSLPSGTTLLINPGPLSAGPRSDHYKLTGKLVGRTAYAWPQLNPSGCVEAAVNAASVVPSILWNQRILRSVVMGLLPSSPDAELNVHGVALPLQISSDVGVGISVATPVRNAVYPNPSWRAQRGHPVIRQEPVSESVQLVLVSSAVQSDFLLDDHAALAMTNSAQPSGTLAITAGPQGYSHEIRADLDNYHFVDNANYNFAGNDYYDYDYAHNDYDHHFEPPLPSPSAVLALKAAQGALLGIRLGMSYKQFHRQPSLKTAVPFAINYAWTVASVCPGPHSFVIAATTTILAPGIQATHEHGIEAGAWTVLNTAVEFTTSVAALAVVFYILPPMAAYTLASAMTAAAVIELLTEAGVGIEAEPKSGARIEAETVTEAEVESETKIAHPWSRPCELIESGEIESDALDGCYHCWSAGSEEPDVVCVGYEEPAVVHIGEMPAPPVTTL